MTGIGLLVGLISFYSWLIIIYVLMSWFRPSSGLLLDAYNALGQVVEPYLGIFRRVIPPLGMIDISPIVAIIVLDLIANVLRRLG